MKFMKYFVLTCENKKGAISIDPVYHLSVIPYKILDEKTELMEHNTFLISKGKQKNDVISFEKHFGNMAISQRLKNFLELTKTKGWSCFPIQIDGIDDPYYALQIIGKSGGILNLEAVNGSVEHPMKRQINESTINGNDIFLVSGTLNILVTEDLAQKMKHENFTNLLIKDAENTFKFIDEENE